MQPPSRVSHGRPVAPLFWRVFLVNGAVLGTATAILAASPATVSSPPLRTEVLVLAVGLVAMLALNALLLRVGLAPLDRLLRIMETVDLLRPGQRLPERGNGSLAPLVRTFNGMLGRLEHERAASSAQALSAQEDERRRIARELHDEIGQSLTVVLLELKRAAADAPPPLRSDLLEVQENARSSLDDVRRIAWRLRPGPLEELGMPAALSALANEFSDLTGLAVQPRIERDLPQVAEEVELVIYRVAQEALTNVARHSHATQVQLQLTRDDDALTLVVHDDGVGGQHREGAGIRGMRERALFVDGQLHVAAHPGRGTRVTLRTPYKGEG